MRHHFANTMHKCLADGNEQDSLFIRRNIYADDIWNSAEEL